MDIALWIAQGMLAFAFGMAGIMKTTKSRTELQPKMAYVEDLTDGQLKGIGTLELLGAVGVLLPWATGILPILTPIAASAFVLLMISAATVHLRRREAFFVPVNLLLGATAAFVAYGRFIL